MSIEDALLESEWDAPFFKVLSMNDTGAASGNQAGVVIPIPLREFFPELNPEMISREMPTVDRRLCVELWDGRRYLGTVDSRYQFQTWGGTRNPESRLTDNLGLLRNIAKGGDILIMQRHALEIERYRLRLVRQESISDFATISDLTRASRWGVITEAPVTDDTIREASEELTASEASAFRMFDESPTSIETRAKRLARTITFRRKLLDLYEGSCSVCRSALRTPSGKSEMEAAHVVPRNLGGINDARNGLGLCRRHHWAFDRGLFAIDCDRRIFVPDATLQIPQNKSLEEFRGAKILEAISGNLRVHSDALDWHFENILIN